MNEKTIVKTDMKKESVIYSRESAIEASIEYFKGDTLAAEVWTNKYALKDMEGNLYENNPDQMHERIAGEFARIEKKFKNSMSYDEIYEAIKNFKYIIPQGSPMAGIGNNHQIVSISNCFVIGNDVDSDSYGGVMKLDQELVQLMKRRAGVGNDLSFIRPNNSPVMNSALTSTGVVPFMERYSNSTREVAQGGRRGALMLSISIEHPDSENFIDAKMTEGKVTGANISVKMTDKFMEAALIGDEYQQKYPVGSNSPTFTKMVDAKNIWNKIVHNAWKSAEPGVLFWDTLIRESIPDCYADLGFRTVSTNPCFPASEYILTDNGYVKFGSLYDNGNSNTVVCDKRISYVDDSSLEEKPENWKIDNEEFGTTNREASHVFLTKADAEIIQIKTSKGFTLNCTPDHHIATTIGMVEAKDITPEHEILISIPNNSGSILNLEPETDEEILSILIGLITGDGTFDKNRKRVHLDFWGDDKIRMKDMVCKYIDILYDKFGDFKNSNNRKLSKYFISEIEDKDKIRISSPWLCTLLNKYDFNRENKYDVPEFIMNLSSTNVGKFYLASIMYCDGSVQGDKKSGYTIRLSQSNKSLLRKIQMIAHSNGMIFGIYKRRNDGNALLPNGNGGKSYYKTKSQYELISLCGSIVKFRESIGFLGDKDKEFKMNVEHNFKIKKSYTDNIIELNKLKNEPVFCIKEDVSKSIIVNGISTRRCGEIPLCPNDSCRLMALNLYSYVNNPFTSKAEFDYKLFHKHVKMAQRLMDDLIELELEKVDIILKKIKNDPETEEIKRTELNLWKKIKEKCEMGRRTGLGITAEGDMLAALGIKYGTNKGNNFTADLHMKLKHSAYEASCEMAQERGSFPIWNSERESKNPFLLRIKEENPSLYNNLVKYGRRNIALLTVAPTGSVSILTQTSSGIEPVFMVSYMRRRKINPDDKDARVDFIDEVGDCWQEYPVFHHKFETYLKVKGYNLEEVKAMKQEDIDVIVAKSPYNGATSNDVDWVKKVEMQGMVQKHIDHSISVTVNLPNDISEEMVAKVYETGWKAGCKGMTVYRDGSRSGVLVSKSEKKEEEKQKFFQDNHAPKRPKKMDAEVVRFQNNLEKWIAVVGTLDGRPYEMFTGKLEGFPAIPNNVDKGFIVKARNDDGTSRYDFQYEDRDGYKVTVEGLSRSFDKEYWNYAKLISGVLRHGMPLPYVVDMIGTLNLEDDVLSTWKNGVVRVVKRFIPDGTKSDNKCPNCDQDSLVFQEGCLACSNCGHSKCGS